MNLQKMFKIMCFEEHNKSPTFGSVGITFSYQFLLLEKSTYYPDQNIERQSNKTLDYSCRQDVLYK